MEELPHDGRLDSVVHQKWHGDPRNEGEGAGQRRTGQQEHGAAQRQGRDTERDEGAAYVLAEDGERTAGQELEQKLVGVEPLRLAPGRRGAKAVV